MTGFLVFQGEVVFFQGDDVSLSGVHFQRTFEITGKWQTIV